MMNKALSSAILDAVIDPTLVIDPDGTIIYFNRAATAAFQSTEQEMVGKNVRILMPDVATTQQENMNNVIGSNSHVVTAQRSDGTTWQASVSTSEVTLKDDDDDEQEEEGDNNKNGNQKKFFVKTLRDVTAFMEREKLFSSVIDEAIDAIFTINERGIITLVNRSACLMFGYTEQEMIGSNISILMPEPHRSAHDKYIHRHLTTGEEKMIGTDRTVTAARKDGSQFQCRLGLSKIVDTSGGGGGGGATTFVGLLHDLTHELQAREADARAELADKMRKQKALFLARYEVLCLQELSVSSLLTQMHTPLYTHPPACPTKFVRP